MVVVSKHLILSNYGINKSPINRKDSKVLTNVKDCIENTDINAFRKRESLKIL